VGLEHPYGDPVLSMQIGTHQGASKEEWRSGHVCALCCDLVGGCKLC
jgi:hypothetical protein